MLLKVIIPIILLVGSIGNSISIYAFTRPSVRGLSTFKFLAYLSLIDQLYLLVGLSHILVIAYVDYDFRNYSNFVCSVHSFFTLYLSHLSSNILAAVGVFRCVTLTTLRPLKPAARIIKASSAAVGVGVGGQTSMAAPAATHVSLSLTNNNRAIINGVVNGSNNSSCANNNNNINTKPQTKVIYSRHSQTEGCILKRIISNFDNADLVVAAIAFVIFLFDSHFLVLMRLDLIEIGSEMVNKTSSSSSSSWSSSNGTTHNETVTQQATVPKHILLTCYPSQERSRIYFDFYTQVYPWIDQFIYSYIPFGIMIVSTIIIIHRLFTINKQLKTTTKPSLMIPPGSNHTVGGSSNTSPPPKKQLHHQQSNGGNHHIGPQEMNEIKPMLGEQDQQKNQQQQGQASPPEKSRTKNDRKSSTVAGNGSLSQSPLIRISLAERLSRRKCESMILNEGAVGPAGAMSRQSDVAKKRSKKNSQIYKLLLTLNIFFFVLVTPLVVSNSFGWLKEGDNVTTQLVYTFAYLNHTLNFVFYGFSCKIYRSIVYDLLKSIFGRFKLL